MSQNMSNPTDPNKGEVVCPVCAEEVLSAFCRYLKEVKETTKDMNYLDWSQWRPFWSQVNVMSKNTAKCAQEWQKRLGEIASDNAKKGNYPKEYPVLSNEEINKQINELIDAVNENRDISVEEIIKFIPFDDVIEQMTLNEFKNTKQAAQDIVNGIIEAVFPADMEIIIAALDNAEDKQDKDNKHDQNVKDDKKQAKLSDDNAVRKCIKTILDLLKDNTGENLRKLGELIPDKRKELLFETAEARRRKVLAGPIDENQKKLGEGARRIVAALHCKQERKYLGDIVGKIEDEVAERRRHTPVSPAIVLIGGGGAAGKTTFVKKLMARLIAIYGKDQVQKLDLDHYFLPVELIGNRANDGKYDNPRNSDIQRAEQNIRTIKEGGELIIPWHDRQEHKLSQQNWLDGSKYRSASVVIIEGLYTLGPMFWSLGHVRIYIDACPLDRAKGRVWRDVNIRKRNERHVVEMLLGREVYHQTFVEPTQAVADYIIRRSATSGVLQVIDDDEVGKCLIEACEKLGVEDKAAELHRMFLKLLERLNNRRATQTEF
ncbi:MAG: uridine kinase [bacterium]